MKKEAKQFNIDEHIISCDISYRGGTLKVDVSELFPNIDDAVMGAYQNYLGGGLAGSIVGASMFMPDELNEAERMLFDEIKEKIKKYFYAVANSEDEEMKDEFNTLSYIKQQAMPASAY